MKPATIELEALGGETVRVASHGHDAVSLVIGHERFGAIARIRLGPAEAALLGAALDEHGGSGDAAAELGPRRS